MPTYTYVCTKCGHEFDKFQKISDKSRPRCPECRCKAERKISGGAGIHFKGSGFYITDYAKAKSGGDSTSAEKSDGAAQSKSGGTEAKSKETKKEKAKGADS